uniref:SSD domain-containing protein n=1 Tax=Caenorhabditis japonica TaxID=281687 RepID=A0A8R1I9G6_CAEJA
MIERVGRAYSRSLYRHPFVFLVAPLLITTVIPAILLFFFPIRLSQNAEIGFDTKDTTLSGPRMAWARMQSSLMYSNRIAFSNPRPIDNNVQQPTNEPTTITKRVKRSWADNLLSAINQVACYDSPVPLMDHLSQVILEVDNYDAIYELPFLDKLCQMQSNISKQLSRFDAFTPYRNVWSVANMFACISPNLRVNCTELEESDVKIVRKILDGCWKYRTPILECRGEKCQGQCATCKGIPEDCSSQIIHDLFYRILPKSLDDSPLLVNTFLPVFTLTGYITQNIPIDVLLYDDLEKSIIEYSEKSNFELKGLLMDVKRDRLLAAALRDSLLALLAALLVMLVVAVHSQSLLYAFVVILLLALSVVGALGVYGLFTDEFPLLNLVTFVLLIAIGSDDAFLLKSNFPSHLNEETFHTFLAHTSFTMFLTCFSTVVPFFINITSNVIVFRCFGLFAGVTVIFNYFMVVSFLPAFLLIQQRHLECFTTPKLPFRGALSHMMYVLLPHVLVQGRYVLMALLSIVAIGGAGITYEGLHLPEYNPLQLFTSDNLHEWYDNNAEKNFEFVAAKIALPLTSRLVWGVEPIYSTGTFRANATSPLRSDPSFSLKTASDVRRLATSLKKARQLPFVEHKPKFWPERFLRWSAQYPCSKGFLCCNMTNPLFSDSYLDFCLRNSTSFLPTSYNDTPIFDNTTFALIGYTAMLPTSLKYNHRFAKLTKSFEALEMTRPVDGWWAPEWWLMSTWFDLLQSIVQDCLSSVVGSLVFVAIFAFIQLKFQAVAAVVTIAGVIFTSSAIVTLLGWVLGVLEAVILVLVVGLSFDYTLHYGAALPAHGCAEHRIREATSKGVGPVTLAAFTSFLAGASMLPALTHAFYQVGVFLVVISITSWTFSTFFYLPMLSLTLPRQSGICPYCEKTNLMHLAPRPRRR